MTFIQLNSNMRIPFLISDESNIHLVTQTQSIRFEGMIVFASFALLILSIKILLLL